MMMMMIIMSNVCVTSLTVILHEILGPFTGVMLSHTGNRPCDAPRPYQRGPIKCTRDPYIQVKPELEYADSLINEN